MDIETIVATTLALTGFGGVVSLLVNVLKKVNVVKDGDSLTWVTGFNLVLMVGVYIVRLIKPEVDLEGVDAQAGQIASIGVLIFQFISTNLGSLLMYKTTKGVPVVGFSNAPDAKGSPKPVV